MRANSPVEFTQDYLFPSPPYDGHPSGLPDGHPQGNPRGLKSDSGGCKGAAQSH